MNEIHHVSMALSRRTFRNLFGYMLFAASTIIPSVTAWKSGEPVQRPAAIQPGMLDRSHTNRIGRRNQSPRELFPTISGWLWLFSRGFLATVGTTIAMMVLMPYSRCKRYALLFGPPTGLAAMAASTFCLSGRTVVYRFEPALIGIFAAIPTGFLWILCCKRPFERQMNGHEV